MENRVIAKTVLIEDVLIEDPLHSVLFEQQKTTYSCKNHGLISGFQPYPPLKYCLNSSKALGKCRITFEDSNNKQILVKFSALSCLKSPISEGSQKIGPPPVLEASGDVIERF